MPPLPKYHPLDHRLHFRASIRTEIRAGGTTTSTQVSYPLTLQPAAQDWGPYCLSVKRGDSEYSGYAPNAADEVVALLARPLHYLEITLDARGRPLKLRNHAAIWQSWQEETAPAVRAAYAGNWVEQRVVEMESDLFSAGALLQNLLQRDLILQSCFSVLEWLAGGGSSPLPARISGVEIALPHKVHFTEEKGGNRTLEITAEGPAAGEEKEWRKLLPKLRSDGELTVAPHIQKRCSYVLPAGSLWPVGLHCKWDISAGENVGKSIYLQLILL